MDSYDIAQIDEAVEAIQDRTVHRPRVGLILGSGLGPLAEEVSIATQIPYAEIPMFASSTAPEHAGMLVMGRLAGHPVMVMKGRVHYYEGYSMAQVTFPVRVMQRLGVSTLIVTNAAGGISSSFEPGDLMLITDHISLPAMSGENPLRGRHDPALGVRFPNMSQAYDLELQTLAHTTADENGTVLREGIYAYVAGPSFETPAEIRLLRSLGADAVGMSTAPEVTVAVHARMRVLGVSAITNLAIAATESGRKTTADEVLEGAKTIGPRLAELLTGVLRRLPR